MSPLTQGAYIVGRFGGIAALAHAIGRPPSTVQGWKERGRIPVDHWPQILTAGATLDPPLRREEFAEHLALAPNEAA